MVQFQQVIEASHIFPAIFCSGVLFFGLLLYVLMYIKSRDSLHLSMVIIGIAGFSFVLSESMILIMGWLLKPDTGMQFHRIEQVGASLLIFGIPYFLHQMLDMTPVWKKFNTILYKIMIIVTLLIIIVAFIYPDAFVSVTQHRHDWLLRQADHGRGVEGPLYVVRDGILALLILYALFSFVIDMVIHKRIKYLLMSFIGLLLAIYGAVIDVISVYTGQFYDFTPELRYARFVVGITLFILLSMGAVLRKYFDIVKETEILHKKMAKEAEINRKQNDFIKHTLKINSEQLYSFSGQLLQILSGFMQNSQDQAAAIEEVSASVEQISAGTENVKSSTDHQFDGIESLSKVMKATSDIMKEMVTLTQEALHKMQDISVNAKSGEESLALMNETMNSIGKSSGEITGIIAIINDISDKINLLSLNAAIEAARAGDYGRGFAVVADEISKLADQTATSIKTIGILIVNNEREIKTGMQNASQVINTINTIIKDIDIIVSQITALSDTVDRQAKENSVAFDSVESVRLQSEQIKMAMDEQKRAIDEISNTIGSINELAQNNATKGLDITETAKMLVTHVQKINKEIDEFQSDI